MCRPRSSRDGFTLIELLVVIAIIAILIGLLLPAVQKVRAAASRLQCKNNMKQIGLAMHAYHDANSRFPAGYISGVSGGTDTGPGWGWAAQLLPYVEQASLQRSLTLGQGIGHSSNAAHRTHRLKVFLCPSDNAPDTFQAAGTSVTVASASYVAVFGNNEIEDNPGAGNGMFFRNSHMRFGDITDGTSNTLFVGERSANRSPVTWTGAVTGADEAPILVLGGADHPPNHPDGHEEDFASRHAMGVNFLFADGSVRSINDSIDTKVWAAIATRSGGEAYAMVD